MPVPATVQAGRLVAGHALPSGRGVPAYMQVAPLGQRTSGTEEAPPEELLEDDTDVALLELVDDWQ